LRIRTQAGGSTYSPLYAAKRKVDGLVPGLFLWWGEVGGERDVGVHTEAHEAADSHEPKAKLSSYKKTKKNTAHCETHEAADSHEPQNALRRAPHQALFPQKFFFVYFYTSTLSQKCTRSVSNP
jgi:hypothetical protein